MFTPTQTSSHFLSEAIREVQKGNTFFSPSVAKHLHNHYRDERNGGGVLQRKSDKLTAREVAVLQRIAEGHANKRVAAELGISAKTVEKHRQHLMDKLRIHDTAGLTRYAIAAGIIDSGVQLTIV